MLAFLCFTGTRKKPLIPAPTFANMKQKLIDLIAGIGPYWNNYMHIIANGKNAYLVHLHGGVFFELFTDEDGVYFEVHWPGPLFRAEPVDLIAWITMLQESAK